MLSYKYKYIGDNPQVLIEQHKEVLNGDVIELDEPIDNTFFVLIPDKTAQDVAEVTKEKKILKEGADQ